MQKPCKLSDYYIGQDGYPQRWDPVAGKVRRISRMVLEEALGRSIKPGLLALHHCDNRACIEETHIYEGTYQQNMDDCVSRGRTAKGSDHGNSKLTEKQIRFVRNSTLTGIAIARQLGISTGAVSMIRNGKRWGHV